MLNLDYTHFRPHLTRCIFGEHSFDFYYLLATSFIYVELVLQKIATKKSIASRTLTVTEKIIIVSDHQSSLWGECAKFMHWNIRDWDPSATDCCWKHGFERSVSFSRSPLVAEIFIRRLKVIFIRRLQAYFGIYRTAAADVHFVRLIACGNWETTC